MTRATFRPQRPELLALIIAVYVALVLNLPFWRMLLGLVAPHRARDWMFVASAGFSIILIFYLVLLLVSQKHLLRAIVFLVLPLSAAVAYFSGEYGVVVDGQLVRSVLETDAREAGDLVTWKLFASIFFLGIIPAIAFCFVPWMPRSFGEDVRTKLKYGGIAFVACVALLFPFWGDVLSLGREHRELKMTLTPVNVISALSAYWRQEDRKRGKALEPYGEDAHRVGRDGERKSLFVIVVGEAARADHFALNGYQRATNPELSKVAELVNYPNAYSCGTDTAQSVPCMFSGFGHDGFTNAKAEVRKNLLDILKRAGVDVVWRENQAGCKGVCARVETETLTGHEVPTVFPSSENFDDILVEGIDKRIATMQRDTVIVLHMMGSHGPAYWKRYPPQFETFMPACKDAQFSRCDLSSIVNAYDNSLVYSDHVLARLIGVLSGATAHGVDAGMLYVSDHGESLGEHGMYLHGMPYALAPDAQIHVPMVIWLSRSLRSARAIDQACLVAHAGTRAGHDNLFHSTLGIMDVPTRVYDPALDLFAGCRIRSGNMPGETVP